MACEGEGIRRKWGDKRRYRYFVAIYHQAWPLHSDDIEEEHGPLPNKSYVPNGLKYVVARNPRSLPGERVRGGSSGWSEELAPCGRFTGSWLQGRTFASDREADRTVERLASGLPIFVTRAVAIAATIGVVVPAWISAGVALLSCC